ncbi:exosome complex protein Rrp42 [Candidatus Bathyarchaeota archaeon]|nr:exosome complex protein Rrp42 [Candidatus Bathyarchaeota archaeon]
MTGSIAKIKQKQMEQLLSKGKRLDGRGLTDYREITLEQGIIERAEGSARVFLGKTEILVGIKIATGKPFPDTPDAGVLTVNCELVPLASPDFEPGPPGEKAIEIARVVDRGIRESKAIDVKKLCIKAGKNVFVVFVDVYALNHDGNLIDASALAAVAALLNTKMPNYEIEDDTVKITQGYTPLTLKSRPITVTIAKINDKLVVDPQLKEEQVMDSRISIAINDEGSICAIQKGGAGYFTTQQIKEATKLAKEKAEEIRKKMGW